MHTLDIEDSKSNSGGGGGGALKWVLIGLGVFILIAAIVAIAVILTLPQTFTCFPHDSRYFVKLVPNVSVSAVEPPMICVAQRTNELTVSGDVFLRYNDEPADADTPATGGAARCWSNVIEDASALTAANESVQGQGVYTKQTVDDVEVSRVGPQFAAFRVGGECTTSEDSECKPYSAVLPSSAVELNITWGTCVDGVVQLDAAEVDDSPSTYDLSWPADGAQALRGQTVRTCTSYTVTYPVIATQTVHRVPELVVVQHHPDAPHAVDATPSRDAPCQHSSFDRIVTFPAPDARDLNPPALCRQDAAAKLTASGAYFVQAKKSASDALQKAACVVTNTLESGSVVANAANGFAVKADKEIAETALALSNCTNVRVDRFESVEACAAVQITLNGADHFDAAAVKPAGTTANELSLLRAVSLRNPAPIDCISSAAVEFRVVEKPVIDRFEPSMICVAERDITVAVVAKDAAAAFLTVDGANATVTVGAAAAKHAARSKCVDLPVKGHKLDLCAQADVVVARDAAIVELQKPTITATNAHIGAASSCDADGTNKLLIVPRPTVTVADPPFACAGTTVTVALTGRYFVEHEAPQIRGKAKVMIGARAFEDTTLPAASCQSLDAPQFTRSLNCSRLEFSLAADTLAAANELAVFNPPPVDCSTPAGVELLVVPLPTLSAVEPAPMVTISESDRNLTFVGTGFIEIVGAADGKPSIVFSRATATPIVLPAVALDGCAPLAHKQRTLNVCTRMTVTLPSASALKQDDIRVYDVAALLPGQQSAMPACQSAPLKVVVVPAIAFTAQPLVPAICGSGTQSLVFESNDFVRLAGVSGTPSLQVELQPLSGGSASGAPLSPSVALSQCDAAVALYGAYSFTACRVATVSVVPSALGGLRQFRLTHLHPTLLGTRTEANGTYTIVTQPSVTSATPTSICIGSSGVTLQLTGQFDTVNGVAPFLSLNGNDFPQRTPSQCGTADANGVARCTSLQTTLDAALAASVPAGPLDIRVAVNDECFGSLQNVVFGLPTPSISAASPPRICYATASTVTLTGTKFAKPPSPTLTASSGGSAARTLTLQDPTSCSAISGTTQQQCTSAVISSFTPQSVGLNVLDDDTPVALTASNGACSITDATRLAVVPVPVLMAVTPPAICFDQTTVVTLSGTRFSAGFVAVRLINNATNTIVVAGGAEFALVNATNTAITLRVNANTLRAGFYDVEVTNVAGCTHTLRGALNVQPTLIVAFAAPPVIYTGINIQVTVFSTGLVAKVDSVILRHENRSVPEFVIAGADTTFAPNNFNKIFFTVPAGKPAGLWDIELRSKIGCVGTANDVLAIADQTTITIGKVEPFFVTAAAGGGIRVETTGTALRPGVSAYLSPVNASASDLAVELGSVAYESNTTLSGVVAPGIATKAYDVIIVNAVGETVGVSRAALRVVAKPLVSLVGVSPIVQEEGKTQDFVASGANFPAAADARVALSCRTPAGATSTTNATICPTGTCVSAGALTYTCPACTATTLVFRVAGGATSGSVCSVVVTDQSNGGAVVTFQAISVKNPSGKFSAGFDSVPMSPNLLAPRHAHQALAVRATDARRMVCAIGGTNNASVAVALGSVECAIVSQFGELSAFAAQPQALATPVAFAGGAVVGAFVYIVGGHNGTAVSAAVQRAHILQPTEVPVVNLDLDIDPDSTAKFGGGAVGVYYYVVSAVYGAADAINPGGESLPSNLVRVKVPNVNGISVRLEWSGAALDGVVSYRIFRTPSPDQLSVDVRLHATLSAASCVSGLCRFVDGGAASTLPAAERVAPLQLGALGRWATLAPLPAALMGVSLAVMPAKPSDPADTRVAMFAVGGFDGAALVRTVSRTIVTVTSPTSCAATARCVRETQTLTAWAGEADLTVARGFATARVIDQSDFGTLAKNQRVILMANGVRGSAGSTVDQADPIGGAAYDCQANANCLAWKADAPGRSGAEVDKQNCFLLRAAVIMWFSGSASTSFSIANNFGMASATDVGQEQTPSQYMSGDVLVNVGGMGGINTRSTNVQAIASSVCVIENGNLYFLGGYTGSNTVSRAVYRLPGV